MRLNSIIGACFFLLLPVALRYPAQTVTSTSPELVLRTGQTGKVAHVVFSPNGKLIASVSQSDTSVKLWNVDTGLELRTLVAGDAPISSIRFNQTGSLLISASTDTLTVWDSATGQKLRSLRKPASASQPFTWNSGWMLFPDTIAGTIRLFEIDSGREKTITVVDNPTLSGTYIPAATVSPDGRFAAVSVLDIKSDAGRRSFKTTIESKVVLCDIAAGAVIKTLSLGRQSGGLDTFFERFGSGGPSLLAFSPDSRVLAVAMPQLKVTGAAITSAAELSLEAVNLDIWDWNVGRKMLGIVRPIPQRTGKVLASALSFSADGRSTFLTVQTYSPGLWSKLQQTDIYSWEVATREVKVFTIPGPSAPTEGLPDFEQMSVNAPSYAVRPDGGLAASLHDRTIQLWDTATGRQTGQLSGHTQAVSCLAFSATGELLATGGADETIRLWDVTKMRELRTFEGKPPAVIAVNFSSDGRWLNIADVFAVNRWESATGRQLRTFGLQAAAVPPASASFSTNSSRLVTTEADGRVVRVWDLDSEREVRTLPIAPQREAGRSVISADGRLVASSDHVFTIQKVTQHAADKFAAGLASQDDLMKVEKEIERLDRRGRRRDRDRMAELAEKKIKLTTDMWALQRMMRDPEDAADALSTIIGPDTPENRPQTRIWDPATGREMHILSGHLVNIEALAFSSDGGFLVTAGTEGVIRIWDTAQARMIRSFGHVRMEAIGISLDNRISGTTNKIELPVSAIAISPDGKRIAAGHSSLWAGEGFARIWDESTGALLATLSGAGDVTAIAFNLDGTRVATGARDGSLKTWNATTGAMIAACTGHRTRIEAISFHPNGRVLASGGTDGLTRLCDPITGEPLAMLVSLSRERDWLAATPDGLFDGSPGAWQRIGWRFSERTRDIAPIETYFNEFFYPGLLGEVLSGRRPKAPRNVLDLDRRQPKINIAVKGDSSAPVASRQVVISLEVVDAAPEVGRTGGSGARDVRLFRNGSLVRVWRGDVLAGAGSRVVLETSVPIVAGENRITAYAFNQDNVRSATAALTITGSDQLKRPATMHIFTVGVNKYSNPEFNLNYAIADAQALSAELERGQARIGRFSRIERISLSDNEATRANILYVISRLAGLDPGPLPARAPKALADVQRTEPEDAVVIYFAGHGTAYQSRFYIVPHDLGYSGKRNLLDRAGAQLIHSQSISDLDLERVLEKLDAGNLLLVIDACESGQALEAEERRRGPMNSKGLAQLAYEKGMYVLTAAQAYQAALEASQLGHGFLTFALVEEGLKTVAADKTPKDGQVSAAEWLDYATLRVPQLQGEGMKRAREQGRNLAFVEGEEIVSDIAQRSFQRPRAFYRLESGIAPLIVAKPDR